MRQWKMEKSGFFMLYSQKNPKSGIIYLIIARLKPFTEFMIKG